MGIPGSKPLDWPVLERPRDVFDVDEQGERAMRERLWDGKTERKPLNQEQSMGDEFSA